MHDYILGVDFGTSKIAAVLIDPIPCKIIKTASKAFAAHNPCGDIRLREQDVETVKASFAMCLKELFNQQEVRIASIGLTGQMHGILGVDKEGTAVTRFVTWQDERGLAPSDDGKTILDEMREKGGLRPIATGYGIVTLYDWIKKGKYRTIAQICTLSDYFGMWLTGNRRPFIDHSMAESIGAFDVKKSEWDYGYISSLGIDKDLFPQIIIPTSIIGTVKASDFCPTNLQDAKVSVSIGDNQASFIGSVREYYSTLLLNIGTGSQISYAVQSLEDENLDLTSIDGYDVCLRPFVECGFLVAGNALSGGTTYTVLRDFFVDIGKNLFRSDAPPDIWERMNSLVRHTDSAGGLTVHPLFYGKRSDTAIRGSIIGINNANFTAAHLIYGTLEGLIRALKDMVGGEVVSKMQYLVGSGNGMRKNVVLREIASRIFQKDITIPSNEEEASIGAAVNAAVAAGMLGGFSEAHSLIQY
jgi:sedoheptulokinase